MAEDANVAETRRLWRAWERGGLEGVLAVVPDDVEWRPATGHGEVLCGTEALRAFMGRRNGTMVDLDLLGVEPAGRHAAIMTATLKRRERRATTNMQVSWVLVFDDRRLRLVSGHPSLTEARQAARNIGRSCVEWVPAPAASGLDVHVRCEDGRIVLSPRGDLDVEGTPVLVSALDGLPADATEVLIDLDGVPFMDSTGLRALFEALRRARAHGWRLVIRPGPHAVRRVITVSGADRVLPLDLVA